MHMGLSSILWENNPKWICTQVRWRVEDNLLEVSLLDGSEFEETLA
jgi:hypothetical protein